MLFHMIPLNETISNYVFRELATSKFILLTQKSRIFSSH